ncbi:GNAT family N-acetyltransferase [Luteimonas sp. SX5]|uniref:GNAT family N-acetyltransferase n=1 Tax=Luteimonas galliterrae TaxID=2940486 RepID=A0ABT0MGW7_9GAMM|nr:GNAT family N-acetyltransferase [Luteimonas galliterrae]MCL1634124.1 GNAT family N-acetyltransferase [Luteimonas galliterrae]
MAPGIAIRLLTPADAEALVSAAPGVFDHEVDPALAAEFLSDPRHHMATAFDGPTVVGMASAVHYVHPDKPAEMWVNEVGVAPTHEGRGLGRAMLRALFERARALGCREAWVCTERDNRAARRMYAAVGGAEQEMVYVTFALDDERTLA